jgi:acyl dehydratase
VSLKFAEDYKPGDTFDLGSFDVTREEIIEFAQKYDPFPFHVDAARVPRPRLVV